jgi:hypothetical protein
LEKRLEARETTIAELEKKAEEQQMKMAQMQVLPTFLLTGVRQRPVEGFALVFSKSSCQRLILAVRLAEGRGRTHSGCYNDEFSHPERRPERRFERRGSRTESFTDA